MSTPFVIFEVGENGTMPTRGSEQAAGLDLYSPEDFFLPHKRSKVVKLNIKSSFASGWFASIRDRSGLAAKGITTLGGVIDSDYRGEWGVILHNCYDPDNEMEYRKADGHYFKKGDRIAQVIFQQCWIGWPVKGKVDGKTFRGDGGFGSTGK